MPIRSFFRLLRGLLTFTRPVVIRFDYTHVIIANKPYLLFSWEYEHAYRLRIEGIGFISYLLSGSAYRQVRPGAQRFTAKISSGWHSAKFSIVLESFETGNTDFQPKPVFRNLAHPVQLFRPKVARLLQTPTPPKFVLKTSNLNYPH